jgi:putative transposase
MRRVIPITEQYQHFVEQSGDQFWLDVHSQVRRLCREGIERESLRLREAYLQCDRYERTADRRDQRNGFYQRDFQTRFGCLRLKIARSRQRSFLPALIQLFQRRSADLTLLVREAFLRGISTRQVGRVLTSLQLEPLSAQTVSRLSRNLDVLVQDFHQRTLADEWAYLFLDGVSLRVRRPAGRQRLQMLVAYGVRRDGSRQLLAFLRSQGESQAAWEGLLEDLVQSHDILYRLSPHILYTPACL